MAKFKGSVYESTRAFVQHEFGPEGVARILSALPPADRELLSSITAIAWVPVEPVLRFHHELERLYGTGDRSLCERAGTFSAGWSMNTVLKMFVRLRSPHWLLDKGANVWSRYHDSGRWELDPELPQRMSGRLLGFEVKDPVFCARLRGWLSGVVELTGGKGAETTEPRCRCRGHDHCAFVMTWKA
jgi:V4R domain